MRKEIQELLEKLNTKNIESLKRTISKKYKLSKFPSNIEILEELDEKH